MGSKAAHVRGAKQTRPHTCHWPGCGKQVPPAMWGCRAHWFRLPVSIRRQLWAAYKPGQEDGDASVAEAYLDAAKAARDWIKEKSDG